MKETFTLEKIDNVVRVEELPKIYEKLELIGEFIQDKLSGLELMECNETNKQEVKNRRTEINNTLNLLESKRKEIKNKINAPYDLFNKKYEDTVKVKLQNASQILTEKINKIESKQKQEKEEEARLYFEEYKNFLGIDFVNFENIGLNITLSITNKKIQDYIKSFLDKVKDDLSLIDSQNYKEEILIEYKKNLNVSFAITTVNNRHKELEELKAKQEIQKNQITIEKEAITKVEQALSVPKAKQESEELLTLVFKVTGTREQLKTIKTFLENGGYTYE